MATMGKMRNGIKKKNGAKKNGVAKKRNPISLARAKAVIKKNGLKAVSKNGSKKKHHKRHGKKRNGIVAVSRTRNGLLGNTRSDAKQVAYLGAGALLTKTGGRLLSNLISPYMAQFGMGKYTEVIADLGIAIVAVPWIANKVGGRTGDLAKHARLGGLLAASLTLVGEIAPSALAFNPFNTSPVVLANGQTMVTPKAVAQIVAQTDASASDKAKVAGAMAALESGRGVGSSFAGARASSAMSMPVNE
jgi:hypothetical protein